MNITLYSTPTCPFCKKVKKFFVDHDVEFTNFDVSVDQGKAEEMIKVSGQMGVPVVVIGEEIVVGFDEGKLKELLKI